MTILVDLQEVTLEGSDRTLLESLSLTISSGDRIGVVGINGVGKTTLLRIIAGSLIPDSGTIRRGRDVRVGLLEQIPRLPSGTVRETLGVGWEIDAALDRLGMLGEVDVETRSLSGGQLKRVALAQVFGEELDVLILDEPTNHLDLNAIQWLENEITSFRGAVVLVSHDRFLLDQVTTRMVEIDRGKTFIHAGGYSRLLEVQAEREEKAASAEQVRRNLARTELAWLRRGVKARATKPQEMCIRDRLNSVLGFTQILQMELESEEDLELVDHVYKSGQHLLTLINEVLDISRVESGIIGLTSEPLLLQELVFECLDIIGPQASERDVGIGYSDSFDYAVLADHLRLKQVILNLLSNAIKYNRSHGSVTLNCQVSKDVVRFSVSDTGLGIAPELRERLFTAFDRLDAEARGIEGTGLGLTLSKTLIEAMGGTLGFETVVDQGTTFWFELPLSGDSPGASLE